jgi:hypothetical protein
MISGKLVSPMLAGSRAAYATVIREPYEGKPPVRFDEGAVGWSAPEDGTVPWTNASVHCSTLLNDNIDPSSIYPFFTGLKDYDGDGIPNALDNNSDNDDYFNDGTDPSPLEGDGEFTDYDSDGVSNAAENNTKNWTGLKWNDADSDNDGLLDGNESYLYDIDADGFYGANDKDSDNDGLPDSWIDGWCYDPYMSGAADSIPGWGHYCIEDMDRQAWEAEEWTGDGLRTSVNYTLNNRTFIETDWNNPDSDGDGITDGDETIIGELIWSDWNYYATDPLSSDTDNDGLNDTNEIFNMSTDPTAVDTDFDGITDNDENDPNIGSSFLTDPATPDTDQDGLLDGYDRYLNEGHFYGELTSHDYDQKTTNPRDPDTDNDSLLDGIEVYGWEAMTIDTHKDYEDITEILREKCLIGDEKCQDDHIGLILSHYHIRHVTSNPNMIYTAVNDIFLNDSVKYSLSLDPRRSDSDGDGILDGTEVFLNTTMDPTIVDYTPPMINITKMDKPAYSRVLTIEYRVIDNNQITRVWMTKDGKDWANHKSLASTDISFSNQIYYTDRDMLITTPIEIHATDKSGNEGSISNESFRGGMDIIGEAVLAAMVYNKYEPFEAGLVMGAYQSLKESIQFPLDFLSHPWDQIEGLASVGKMIKCDGTLLRMMAQGVYYSMNRTNPYKTTVVHEPGTQGTYDPDWSHYQSNDYREYSYGFYGGYLAGMIVIGWATSQGTASVGQVAKEASSMLLASAADAEGITSQIEGTGTGLLQKLKDAAQAYRQMQGPTKMVVTSAMYLGVTIGGAYVAQLFFPQLFDSWRSAFFGTAFIIMTVKGTSDDFAQGFQDLPKPLEKKL